MVEGVYHEPASVTVTRLICQLILTLTIFIGAGLLMIAHPEYGYGVSVLLGALIGSWFGVVGVDRRHIKAIAARKAADD
jgi:uncharacterized membrane protein YfcA